MAAVEKVKVALIGCGGFSRGQAQSAIQRSEMLDVVACYDPDRAAATEAAARFGTAVCDSFDQAVAARGVEAVLLLTPNDVHRPQAEAAFAAGKHVFVEKPMANSVADCAAMIRSGEKAGRLLMVGHMMRRYQTVRLAHEALRSGRLGRPLGADAHYSHSGGKTLPPTAWRADPRRCPGLPLNVIGCHMVDILNMLFGRPRTVAAFHRQAWVPTNNDCTSTLIAYDPPVTAALVSHYCAPLTHELRIVGTEGVADVHRHGAEFVLRIGKEEVERRQFPDDAPLKNEFVVFGRAIRFGEPLETDGLVGAEAVAVVEASVISAREKRFVDISELLQGL